MIIKYKSIIRAILEPEASKHGFVFSSGRRMISTKPLAYFDRIIDGKKQGFEIIQDLLDGCTIIFRGFGVEKKYHYTDDDSFKECIYKIKDYLEKEGYFILDTNLQINYFSLEDALYVEKNYEMLAREYISSSCLFKIDVNDAIDIISDDIEKLFEVEWNIAKEKLIELSAALTAVMLHFFPGTYITRYDTSEYYYVEKIKDISIVASEAPLQLVYDAYIEHDCVTWLKDFIKAYFD